jgi:hypothetical protein
VQTNALTYNASNGVGITSSIAYGYVIVVTDSNVAVSNLQIKGTGFHGGTLNAQGVETITVDDCILLNRANAIRPVLAGSAGMKVRNSLITSLVSGIPYVVGGSIDIGLGGPSLYFCTIVAPSDILIAPTSVLNYLYGTATAENCAFFGCTAINAGTTVVTFTACMTDIGSPPSGVTGGKTYANQFQGTTTASADFREKSAADLRGAGTADNTNGATDIAGTARPRAGHWDIGCWELAGSSTILAADAWMPVELLPLQRIDRPLRVEVIVTQRAGCGLIELMATQRADPRTPSELVAILHSDRGVPLEDGSGVATDTAGRVESLVQAVAEWRVVTEWPIRLLGNIAAAGEFTTALACGAPISPEWTEAIATLLGADAVLPIDWSALPASVLVSLGRLLASPGKHRQLATPGRLRLLKRL